MSDIVERLKDAEIATHALFDHIFQHAREEIELLRAKIEAVERQEPVATVRINAINGNPSVDFVPGHHYLHHNDKLYLAPGAGCAPSVPVGLITDYFVSISDHAARQEEPQAQAEIGDLLRMLAAVPCAQPAPIIPEGWLRAIDEALVVAHIGVANASDTYEQAKSKLNNLIGFHVDGATDPAVNGGYKLVSVRMRPKTKGAGE